MAGLNDIVPITPLSLPDVYNAAARYNNLQTGNQLQKLQLQGAQRTQGALQAFADRKDPNDYSALNATPELMGQGLGLQEKTVTLQQERENQSLQDKARAAAKYLSYSGDPTTQAQLWPQIIGDLKAKGHMGELEAQTALNAPPERRDAAARGFIAQQKPEVMLPHPGVTNTSPWGMQEYGIYDPVSQTTRTAPAATSGSAPGVGQEASAAGNVRSPGNVRGEDFLKIVEAQPQFGRAMADKIRNINIGKEQPPPPNPRPGSPGFIEDLLLHQAYPDFNAATWQARKREMDDATGSGKGAQNFQSAGTLIGHLDIMRQLLPLLNNANWGPDAARKYLTGPVNALLFGKGEGSYSQAVAKWDQTAHLAAKELAKITSGTGGTGEGEVAKLEAPFDHNRADAELSGALDNAVGLMDSRLVEKTNTWNRAFGGTDQEMPSHRGWLAPEHQRVLNKIEGKTGDNAIIYANPVANPRYNKDSAGRVDPAASGKTDLGSLQNRGAQQPAPIAEGQPGSRSNPVPVASPEEARRLRPGMGIHYKKPDGTINVIP